jgi:hypothetical protein
VIDHLPPIVCSSWQRQDPRVYQGAVLAGLFGYGVVWPDVAVSGIQTVVILATVLLTQALCRRLWKFPTYDLRSVLLAGLSLCLLRPTHILPRAMLLAYLT